MRVRYRLHAGLGRGRCGTVLLARCRVGWYPRLSIGARGEMGQPSRGGRVPSCSRSLRGACGKGPKLGIQVVGREAPRDVGGDAESGRHAWGSMYLDGEDDGWRERGEARASVARDSNREWAGDA